MDGLMAKLPQGGGGGGLHRWQKWRSTGQEKASVVELGEGREGQRTPTRGP